jgi:hypothetical protein
VERVQSRIGSAEENTVPANLPDVVLRDFDLDADRDVDGIVALFTEDATVIDEGEAREGIEAIRGWQTGAASAYQYTTTTIDSEALGGDRYRVRARLEGNFPGATVDLNYDFDLDRVNRLRIAP